MTDKKELFMTGLGAQRLRARSHLDDGAVTVGYCADRERVVHELNDALATELVCMLRYRRHHFMASGIHSKGVAAEFLGHAEEEMMHADRLAQRIVQLGGAPDFNPDRLRSHSHTEQVEGLNLGDMIRENQVAERVAIDGYREFIQYLGDKDPTTRRMLEEILAAEEGHADEMADMWAVQPDAVIHRVASPEHPGAAPPCT